VRSPQILLGDELTSALDETLQAKVLESLKQIQRESKITIVLVAHRLSTIAQADTIYVLDNGTVIEQGSFEELKSKPSRAFKTLMSAQLGG
jgi:ABC-type multidrug transport system fused ATPase/permease subunit